MLKRIKGFRPIELFIIIAISGILVALFVPGVITAIHRTKQTQTMHDIKKISTAIAEYIIVNGISPTQDGTFTIESKFYTALYPFYVKSLPFKDRWGNDFRVYCGLAVNGNYGISGADEADFLVVSYGRDKKLEDFKYDSKNIEAGLFKVLRSKDFNKDLVMFNGCWIRASKKIVEEEPMKTGSSFFVFYAIRLTGDFYLIYT